MFFLGGDMKTTYFTAKNLFLTLLVVAILFVAVFSLPLSPARADDVVHVTVEDGKYILHWTAYSDDTASFNGYVISVDGVFTYLDNHFFTYFDVTHLLKGAGECQISVYANLNGDLSHIGTCLVKVTAPLGKVENIGVSGDFLTWDGVSGATGYHVFLNNLFVSSTENTFFDLSSHLTFSKGTVSVALLPFTDNPYLTQSSPTYFSFECIEHIFVDLTLYMSLTQGGVKVSWQSFDGVTFNYVLTKFVDGTLSTSGGILPSNQVVFDDLADGEYTFNLYGENPYSVFSFGTFSFSVEEGEIAYD